MITGGCLCGAVRYAVDALPLVTRTCWCRLCQHLGGGSGTVNVGFPAASVAMTGALATYVGPADSGAVLHRTFCPVCGTPVSSQAESRRHQIFLRAGTLDDPEVARPAMTIWVAAAPSWACIAEDLPRVERQPPPAA